MKNKKDLSRLLNYNILDLLNKTERAGDWDMPVLYCDTKVYPDYLALYKEKGKYGQSFLTAVCFYSYDNEFDGKDGLFAAIYYEDEKRLAYFKERFTGVKFFIAPDYSVFGDIHRIENLYRVWKSRIVALWLISELHAVVIPNVSYAGKDSFPIYFSGLEKCQVVAFSTKSHMRNIEERNLFIEAVKYAVDHLPLRAIVVYSACGRDEGCLELFQYAVNKGIEIILPDNTLRSRNIELLQEREAQ